MVKTLLNYSLFIYPVLLLVLLFVKAKVMPKGQFKEDFFDLNDSKNLQVVAAFGVLMHHLTQLITEYGNKDKGPIDSFNSMGILFVTIFFFSSGYGLITSYLKKENYLKGFLLSRYTKIIVPFAILNVVYILPGLADFRIRSISELLTSLFGITLINTNAWFIVELSVLYMVFYLAFKSFKNTKKSILVVTLIAAVLVIISVLLGHDKTQLNGHWFMGEWWFNTTMMFPLGLIVGYNKDKIMNILKKTYGLWVALSVIFFWLTFIVEEYVLVRFGYYEETYTSMGYPSKFLTLSAQIILCVAFMFMILVFGMKITTGNKVLKFLSPFCMEMYLVHDLFFGGYGALNTMTDVVFWGITIVAVLIVAIGLHYLDKFVISVIVGYSNGEFDVAETIEKKNENDKKKLVIKRIILVLITLAMATFVCIVGTLYINTVGRGKLVDDAIVKIQNAYIGDTIRYGHIDRDEIEWTLLDKQDGKALLISKYVLFESAYNQQHVSCTYENSTLRKILAEQGYNECFYSAEREHMVADEATGDYVFLLSEEEVTEYMASKEDRITHHYLATAVNNTYKASWWWLRSEDYTLTPSVIFLDGEVMPDYKNVNTATGGVRPAIWVAY